jgi:hypothetical protein
MRLAVRPTRTTLLVSAVGVLSAHGASAEDLARPAPAATEAPPPPASQDRAVAGSAPATPLSKKASLPVETTEAELSQVEVRPQTLSLYGFSDFGFDEFYTSDRSQLNALFPTRKGTFVLGNANVFFDAEPYEGWRSLIEVRFTNLPHGVERSLSSPLGDPYDRTSTEVQDFTSPSVRDDVVLGSVIIERAQTEYAVSDALKIMGGYFFTPFGIWNVDHGTPTLISLLLPSFESDGYLMKQQLGVQAYGSLYTSNWELGYHAYVGNGRTPSQVDFTEDKTVGGRLFASSVGTAVKTRFGVSAYRAPGSDTKKEVVSLIPYLVRTEETVASKEWAVGADASVDAGPFRLRTEGFVRRIEYERGKRGQNPDSYYGNAYVLAAYQLPWAGLEPYLYVEGIRFTSALGDVALLPSLGLNVHFNPAVQLKLQYAEARFFDVTTKGRTPSDNDVRNVAARLVVSF